MLTMANIFGVVINTDVIVVVVAAAAAAAAVIVTPATVLVDYAAEKDRAHASSGRRCRKRSRRRDGCTATAKFFFRRGA